MSRSEKTIFWIIFSLLFSVLAWWKCLSWVEGYADNVLEAELVDNVAHRGLPLTQLQASIKQAVDLWYMKVDELCRNPLKVPPEREFNYFRWHPYVILYLLAPLAWFLPGSYMISAMIVASFVGLLAAAYWLLRKRGVNPWCAGAFCCLIMAHPGWYLAIQGQVYPDRLFLLTGMLLLIALFSPQARMKWILLFGILSILITERIGLVCGAFLFGASILYFRKLAALRWKIILMSFGCALYSMVLIKFFIQYSATEGFSSNFIWPIIKMHLSTPSFVEALAVFFIFNFAYLGLFSVFEWRGLLLTLGVMVPNILGNVGGAEKYNWVTHYHAMYFPFLVWASLEGFAKLYNFSRKRTARVLLFTVILLLTSLSAAMPPKETYKTLGYRWKNYLQHPLYFSIHEMPAFYGQNATRPLFKDIVPIIKRTIPKGSVVGTFEPIMPSLYGWADILFYPDGLEDADYALVRYEKDESGKYIYSGEVCYQGAEDCARLSKCLTERMRAAGYNTETPVLLGTRSFAILKREHQSSLPGKQ
jgi:hypothetical protein